MSSKGKGHTINFLKMGQMISCQDLGFYRRSNLSWTYIDKRLNNAAPVQRSCGKPFKRKQIVFVEFKIIIIVELSHFCRL